MFTLTKSSFAGTSPSLVQSPVHPGVAIGGVGVGVVSDVAVTLRARPPRRSGAGGGQS